jgi:hypothetical protein
MTTSKLLGVVLVAIGLFGLAAGGRLSIPDMGGLVSNAEARV